MPMTVITLKSVPQSLRGDLTRWMQEIATGVYVGNFNSRIREYLWNRVKETMGHGEASIALQQEMNSAMILLQRILCALLLIMMVYH